MSHMRGKTDLPPQPSTKLAFQLGKFCGEPAPENGQRSGRLRFRGKHFCFAATFFQRCRDAAGQASTAESGDDGVNVGQVFENLQPG